jgi:hypothetical protein
VYETGAYTGVAEPATPTRSDLLRAALDYAARGWPVFPCKPGGKRPLTERGHLDATTDPSKITAWWNRWPDANIGVPTGERSGILALDVDQPAGLDELEREHGRLPATRTHSTGSGGMHLLFEYPDGEEVRNSAGKLAPGLDIRGEGGYIIAPPSATTRSYKLLDDLPLADPPAGLLEAIRRKPEPRSGAPGGRAALSDAGDGPIPDGRRDDTLFHIGCKLRGEGHDEPAILDALDRVNRARCTPPLPDDQVRIKARQAARYPKGNATAKASAETLDALDGIEAGRLWGENWKGSRWKVPRSVFVALIKQARRHGTLIPAGVRVTMSTRTLALAAAASHPSTLKAVRRLREAGMLRKDDADRSGTEAGAFVLVAPAQRLTTHPPGYAPGESGGASGKGLRAPLTAPRLRWTAPIVECEGGICVRVGTLRRLGKTCEQIVDVLERAPGPMGLEDLAEALGSKRPRDLRRRVVSRLEDAGVVVAHNTGRMETISLAHDWLDRLNAERERAGELDAYRRDMARYERERKAYREHADKPADPAPTEAEMDQARENRPDGLIGELEPVPDVVELDEGVDVDLLVALSDALIRWPDHRHDYPSWWASTLHVEDYLTYRPEASEVAHALALLPERRVA